MSYIAIGIVGVGTGLSVYGQVQSGRSQKSAANYNAAVARQQADANDQAMESATTLSHEQSRKIKASQRAGYAKAGADASAGTPLEVMVEQAGEIELDILTERHNQMRKSDAIRNQADMTQFAGNQAATASYIGAGATLLQGAGKGYSLHKDR